jgi:hypothetical protein
LSPFPDLGNIVNTEGGADEDIMIRISRARIAFNILHPIWKSSALSLQNKIRIFNTNVKAVLLYGSKINMKRDNDKCQQIADLH